MTLAVIIGLSIVIYVNQATKEAEEFSFDNVGEMITDGGLVTIANMTLTLGSALTIFILFVLPVISIGVIV